MSAVVRPCRRGVLASVLLAAMTLAAAHPAPAKTAIVLNSDEDSLSVIDGDAYREISRVHIGRQPHHLALTPDGKVLIVAMAEGNELLFIDRATGAVRDKRVASDPYQVGFSPDGHWFVTTSLRLDRVDIWHAANFEVAFRLPASSMPSHIAFSRDSRTVYITLQGTRSLVAIDLASGNVLWTVPVGRQPAGLWMRPSDTLLVAIMGSDHIAEIDPRDGKVLRRIRTGRGAHNFLLSPDGGTLYVSNRVAGTITALDAASLAVSGTIAAPGGPDDMALSPDGGEIWVTGRWRATVDVIERASGALKTRVRVGRSPHGIFVY